MASSSAADQLICANPSCWFLAHKDQDFGGFCSFKCEWRALSKTTTKKKHGPLCCRTPASPSNFRAACELSARKEEVALVEAAPPIFKATATNPDLLKQALQALDAAHAQQCSSASVAEFIGDTQAEWPVEIVMDECVYKRVIADAPFYNFTGLYSL